MNHDQSTSCGLTPRSEVFSSMELTGTPEELLAKSLTEKLELLQIERDDTQE